MAVCRSDLIWPSATSAKAIVRSCSSSTLTTDHVPNGGQRRPFAAMIKIITATLIEENERPVNGRFRRDFAGFEAFQRSDAGADRAQQERRKMGVIGWFGSRVTRGLR